MRGLNFFQYSKRWSRSAIVAVIVVGVTAAAALAALALALAFPRDTHGLKESAGAAWVAVQPAGAARELLAQGVIDGQVSVDVVAAFEGVVKSAAVEAGDTVAKGAVLLELSTSTLQSQILEAKAATLKTAQAAGEARHWKTGSAYRTALRQVTSDQLNEAEAHRKLADTQRLFDQGIVARDELQQSQQAVQSAKSQLANSQESVAQIEEKFSSSAVKLAELEHAAQQAKLSKLEGHLQASRVRAPIDGVVTLVGPRNAESQLGGNPSAVGSKAAEGALIARVVDATKVRVIGSVVEASVGLVKAGQRATISPVSQPGLVLEGRVSRVSALPLDTGIFNVYDQRRTAKFQIVIEASAPKDAKVSLPKLGTNAEIAIVLDENTEAGLLVPLGAVRPTKPGEAEVLARRAGQPPRVVVVRLGATTAQSVHVQGLTLEDEVRVEKANSPQALGDGAELAADTADPAADHNAEGLRSMLRKFFNGGESSQY